MDIITINNLTKRFGKVRALHNVSFTVEQGEVFGFLGPNGAGKSTTIRTVLGMIKPNAGNVQVFGLDAFKEVKQIHKRIAYVPGDVNLWGNLTGGQVIDMFIKLKSGKGGKLNQEQRRSKNYFIDVFELDPTKKCRTYSKGNRQKVALVAAFASEGELLIFDEPTSGLDPIMEKRFQEHVLHDKKQGKTILLSSHILSEVDALADRIGIIREGEMIEVGRLEDIKQHTDLENLFLRAYGESNLGQ
jgi:ABC-2 type transport system ATP-binding protein